MGLSRINSIYIEGLGRGFPLSPLLFALAIEPLAAKLREGDRVRGLQIGDLEERVSLYADDMLLYLSDPDSSLSFLLIQEFGDFSGFRINWAKSTLFLLDPKPDLVIPAHCPIIVRDKFNIWKLVFNYH